MYQGGPLHKPFFIAINCQGQVIIGPNKKNSGNICVRRVGDSSLIYEDMNPEMGILLQLIPSGYNEEMG